METEELIEHILRQKHLEEMMNRPGAYTHLKVWIMSK